MRPECTSCAEREAHSGLHPDALARLSEILGLHTADVFAQHREVEQGFHQRNIIGRQNLVEAFAHVATLFQESSELDRDGQLAQVSFIEDHLRRTMMESFELLANRRIADVRGSSRHDSVHRRYHSHAAPLIRRGRLPGHITPTEVESRFGHIAERMVEARKEKVADGGWEAWKEASADLREAAIEIERLGQEMRAAVDAAVEARRWVIGIGLTLTLFVASILIAIFL